MKKTLILVFLVIFFVVSFVAGGRFNQRGVTQNIVDTGERRILHYVDPMNPANTTKEPGIAPCGMPMEPVYADEDNPGGTGGNSGGPADVLGTVRINTQKQQITGVQTDEVKIATEASKIRALGRVVPDQNKVYALVAATDGWMGEIHGSTIGSLVRKDQLMGKIKVYDYDFFTWQQRYLTELGNAGRRTVFLSNTSGAEEKMKKSVSARQKAGVILPDIGGPIALPSSASTQWVIPPGAMQYGENPPKQAQSDAPPPAEQAMDMPVQQDQQMEMPRSTDSPDIPELPNEQDQVPELPTDPVPDLPMGPVPDLPTDDGPPINEPNPPAATDSMMPSIELRPPAMVANMPDMKQENPEKPATDHSQHMKTMAKEKKSNLFFVKEDDILYASKARQELLDFGVVESQLAQLAETGVYFTSVEFRSPVDGLVLSRNVSPRQKINRGTEYFRVADLSSVWVETDIYDIEAEYIQPGVQAIISMPRMGEYYPATVSEVLPRYDATGRSLKVRLEMDNPEYTFLPDMFVDVEFLLDLPQSITVPSSAVIDSGKRKTVYVVTGDGIFEPREVLTGWRFNGRVAITGGLVAGEQIVVSGNFLIDSESRMKLAAARLMEDGVGMSAAKPTPLQAPKPTPATALEKPSEIQNRFAGKSSAETVVDPVCGMNIDPKKAEEGGLTLEANGQTYYFCSEECAVEYHRHGGYTVASTDAESLAEPAASLTDSDEPLPHSSMNHGKQEEADQHMEHAL